MKHPVITTASHQGKLLIIDTQHELILVHDAHGSLMGGIPWGSLIDHLLASDEDARFVHCRTHPRAPLALKIRYSTPEGKQFDSLTGGIGGGGLFIESGSPLAEGTEVAIEFVLPDRPWEKLKAKGKVAWTRNRPERHLLFPGMGVQFTDIDEKTQAQLVELVDALNRNRVLPPAL